MQPGPAFSLIWPRKSFLIKSENLNLQEANFQKFLFTFQLKKEVQSSH